MAANMSPEEELKMLREKNLQLTEKNNQLTQKTTQLTQENQQMIPYTFTDLLTRCHKEYAEVLVEPVKSKCTSGSVGNPHGKLVPLALRAWTEFPSLQESTFRKVSAIYDQCKEPPASFPSPYAISNSIKTKGRLLARELDLRRQQGDCVEDIVDIVIRDLISQRKPPDEFKLGIDIQIDNHANNLTRGAENTPVAHFTDKIFIRGRRCSAAHRRY